MVSNGTAWNREAKFTIIIFFKRVVYLHPLYAASVAQKKRTHTNFKKSKDLPPMRVFEGMLIQNEPNIIP